MMGPIVRRKLAETRGTRWTRGSGRAIRPRIAALLAILLLLLLAPGLLRPFDAVAQPADKGKSPADAPGAKAGPPQGPPPALVRLGAVSQKDLQPHFEIVGRLREVRRTIVGIGQQGRVIEVAAEEGRRVEGGKTVLARIDPTFSVIAQESARNQLAQADAEVREAGANLDQATRDREYYEELAKTNSAKPREVDNARSTEQAAAARHERAKAAVAYAKSEIERTKEEHVRFECIAPFDGVVVRKWMEVGQWVQKGASVVELISHGQVDAIVDVPEKLVAGLDTGKEVEVQIESLNKRVTGKVEAIVPDATNVARTFPVKIRLDDLKGKLMPGMSVTAWLPAGTSQMTLTVPRDAVLSTSSGNAVWVAIPKDDGLITLKVDVDVLFGVGDQYAVRINRKNLGPPLAPGMQVIIEGGERILFPGQPLKLLGSR